MKTIAVLVLCAVPAFAQPTRVIVHHNGEIELVEDDQAFAVNPAATVPVFTETAKGELIPGVKYRGLSESGYHSKKYPGALVQASDGEWEVEYYYWSVIHGPKNIMWEREIAHSDHIPVITSSSPPSTQHARGASITREYDHSGAPDNITESQMLFVTNRVMESFRQLFKDDSVVAHFEFVWERHGKNGILAFSDVVESAQSYSVIRNRMTTLYESDSQDTDFFENGLYNNFPLGSSIGYARQGNATDSTNAIRLTWPLRTRLIGSG